EARGALELDESDVQRRPKTLWGRVERRVRHDLADARHRRRCHARRMVRAVRRRRRDDQTTPRAARGRDSLGHCIEASAIGLRRGGADRGAEWLRNSGRLIESPESLRTSARSAACAERLRNSVRLIESPESLRASARSAACAEWLRNSARLIESRESL